MTTVLGAVVSMGRGLARVRMVRHARRQRRVVASTAALVLLAVVSGCASAVRQPVNKESRRCASSHDERCGSRHTSRLLTLHDMGIERMGHALATIRPGGGEVVRIVPLLLCSRGLPPAVTGKKERAPRSQKSCYGELGTLLGPIRHAYVKGRRYLTTLPAANGPEFANATQAQRAGSLRVLSIVATGGCTGAAPHEHPYDLAFGVLRDLRAAVTVRHSDVVKNATEVKIPRDLDPEGVLVYALLEPGRNEVVVTARGGRVVTEYEFAVPRATPGCPVGGGR